MVEPAASAPPVALRRPGSSPWIHGPAVVWVLGMLALGFRSPVLYESSLQEDHFVEWWTVALFGSAGLFALRLAWRERRIFDALVGTFCVFVAGEEFSWGQRLLGLTPPDAFLEHNRQQELTLHNFADLFGQPKWILMMALAGFGVVMPAVAASRPGRRLLTRLGASVPAPPLAGWLVVAVALLWWYPLTLTGEWVEALAGGLFLAAYAPGVLPGLCAAALGAGGALLLASFGGSRGATEAELACARAETTGLAEDLAWGTAATGRLAGASSVHKRLYTAIEEGYVRREGMAEYGDATCDGVARTPERREFGVDPWGTAYWLLVERQEEAIDLVVYSFGPNRRRDGPPGGDGGDDVAATIHITP